MSYLCASYKDDEAYRATPSILGREVVRYIEREKSREKPRTEVRTLLVSNLQPTPRENSTPPSLTFIPAFHHLPKWAWSVLGVHEISTYRVPACFSSYRVDLRISGKTQALEMTLLIVVPLTFKLKGEPTEYSTLLIIAEKKRANFTFMLITVLYLNSQ